MRKQQQEEHARQVAIAVNEALDRRERERNPAPLQTYQERQEEHARQLERNVDEALAQHARERGPTPPPAPRVPHRDDEAARRARDTEERARAGKPPARVTPMSPPRDFRAHADPIGAQLDRIISDRRRNNR